MWKNLLIFAVATIPFSVLIGMLEGLDLRTPHGLGLIMGNSAGTVFGAAIIASIPVGLFWLFKRRLMPGAYIVLWAVWGLLMIGRIAGLATKGS